MSYVAASVLGFYLTKRLHGQPLLGFAWARVVPSKRLQLVLAGCWFLQELLGLGLEVFNLFENNKFFVYITLKIKI
jgi:hypothetical protein